MKYNAYLCGINIKTGGLKMATTTTIPSQAEIIINVSDMAVASDIRRLLKRVSGITDIKIKKTKSEVELSLEEADKGLVTEWNSVDDYFNKMLSK